MRLLSNLKYFIKRNKPVIMRQQTFDAYVIRAINNELDMADKNRWRVLNLVIWDLERLRANTWDQNKITHIQEYLKHSFNLEGVMTMTKKKTIAEKLNEIKLSTIVKADDFIDVNIDVPEDMKDFFNQHQKIFLPRILPLLVTMNLTGQVCFSCYIAVNGKRYAFAIGESKPDGTPLN